MEENKGPFESTDVVEIVGISSIYLNKFVERKLYGIGPSARGGTGRGSRRWFSVDDVFGIAFVWWLFEAGFRTEVIKRLLRELGKSTKANANLAAKELYESEAEFLLIVRSPRLSGCKKPRTPQNAIWAAGSDVTEQMEAMDKESLHILPVRRLFRNFVERL